MGAPQRIRLSLDDYEISAFKLDIPYDPQKTKLTCKSCSPRRTRLIRLVSIIQFLIGSEKHIEIFECAHCERQWAVTWYDPSVALVSGE